MFRVLKELLKQKYIFTLSKKAHSRVVYPHVHGISVSTVTSSHHYPNPKWARTYYVKYIVFKKARCYPIQTFSFKPFVWKMKCCVKELTLSYMKRSHLPRVTLALVWFNVGFNVFFFFLSVCVCACMCAILWSINVYNFTTWQWLELSETNYFCFSDCVCVSVSMKRRIPKYKFYALHRYTSECCEPAFQVKENLGGGCEGT